MGTQRRSLKIISLLAIASFSFPAYSEDSPELLLIQGKIQSAQKKVGQLIENNPNDARAHLLQGRIHFTLGHYDQAIRSLVQSIALTPEAIEAHLLMAQSYQKLNQSNRAIAILHNTLNLNPGHPEAIYQLGKIYQLEGGDTQSLAYYTQLQSLNKAYKDSLHQIGVLHQKQGHFEKAVSAYKENLAIYPEFIPSQVQWAKILYKTRALTEAQSLLQNILKQAPEHAESHYLLGRLYYAEFKKKEQGLKHLNLAIKKTPYYTDARSLRGILHFQNKSYTQALNDFLTALEYAPERADIYRNLAVTYTKLGQSKPAYEAFQNYLKYRPNAGDRAEIEALLKSLKPYVS